MPRPVNALIVDDEPHVIVLLSAILKQLGVSTIWSAADGPSAVEQAAARKPQVVLLDLNLPQVDGLQVLAKLKSDFPKMPIIIVSAQSTLRTFERTRDLGAQAYVLKYGAKSDVTKQLSDAFDRIADLVADGSNEDGEKSASPA